jgi:hypothetical protein
MTKPAPTNACSKPWRHSVRPRLTKRKSFNICSTEKGRGDFSRIFSASLAVFSLRPAFFQKNQHLLAADRFLTFF